MSFEALLANAAMQQFGGGAGGGVAAGGDLRSLDQTARIGDTVVTPTVGGAISINAGLKPWQLGLGLAAALLVGVYLLRKKG